MNLECQYIYKSGEKCLKTSCKNKKHKVKNTIEEKDLDKVCQYIYKSGKKKDKKCLKTSCKNCKHKVENTIEEKNNLDKVNLECQYIFKSGKKKNKKCLKTSCKNCKHKVENKKNPIEEKIKELTIMDLIKVLYNEFNFIYNNKLPTNIILIDENTGDEKIIVDIIQEDITFKNLVEYCFHRYRSLKNEKSIGDFKKIHYPINNFILLDHKLALYNKHLFLMLIADIKAKF